MIIGVVVMVGGERCYTSVVVMVVGVSVVEILSSKSWKKSTQPWAAGQSCRCCCCRRRRCLLLVSKVFVAVAVQLEAVVCGCVVVGDAVGVESKWNGKRRTGGGG